ncbi:MAG: hypothetical protein ACW96M_06425 [Candidatus Thorarchaeota archaeon]
MSNYQRNTSMVACIFAVILIGALAVGALTYFGSTNLNWNPATTDFAFEAEVGATTGIVTLDIDLDAGGVSVSFVDNASLLYDIDIVVDNTTIVQDGVPTVTFSSNTIGFDYTAAGVNITLGSGVNYTLDIDANAGGVDIELDTGAHVGDVTVLVTAGGINLVMTDDAVLLGNSTFDFESTVGGISILVDLPLGIGGSIECSAGLGGVTITAAGWTEITSSHYETADYGTASQSLTILAESEVGGISATVT